MRRAILVFAIALLSGCTAASFKQPIAEFSKATADASTSFESYADALDKLNYDENISAIAAGKKSVEPDGCEAGDKKCVLLVVGDRTKKPIKSQLLPNIRKLMAAINLYAKSLEAIALADDVAQLKTASEAIPANLIELAKATDALNAQLGHKTNLSTQATAFITPIADIVTTGLIKYADYEKLKALRDATGQMDQIFPQAMRVFSVIASSNIAIDRSTLYGKYVHARNTYKEAAKKGDVEKTKSALDAYQDAAEAYNVALKAHPESVFTKLGKAHAALVNAVYMPDPDFKTVFALLQQIGETAASLAKDAKALDQALHPKEQA